MDIGSTFLLYVFCEVHYCCMTLMCIRVVFVKSFVYILISRSLTLSFSHHFRLQKCTVSLKINPLCGTAFISRTYHYKTKSAIAPECCEFIHHHHCLSWDRVPRDILETSSTTISDVDTKC